MQTNRAIVSLIFAAALSGAASAQTTDAAAPSAPAPAASRAVIHAPRGDIPEAARRAHQNGQVTLDCLVLETGRLNCSVMEETTPGWGFSDAALQMSSKFRMAARTADGRPTANGHARFTIDFSPDTAANRAR